MKFNLPLGPRFVISAVALTLSLGVSAHAADVDLDVSGKPAEACLNTEKALRMVMNIWANGATETYARVKPDLETSLRAQGERGAQVLTVFQAMMPRIEANEFLPPKVISRFEGHQILRAETHKLCMKTVTAQ